ncbi:MAG: hypothetical protein PHC94_03810 [Methylobacter sp.]|nr:hypothetical protein [Methylobacter sp.]
MKHILNTALLAAAILSAANANAATTVVDFEGITSENLIDGYGGLSGWEGIGGFVGPSFGGVGLGENVFYGLQGELRFNNGPVIFHGSHYQAYAFDPQSPFTTLSLFYQNQLVHQTAYHSLSTGTLEWLSSGYSGLVDKIYIYGGGEGFGIDNLTYSAAPVPVPGAVWLFGSGLAGLMLRTRRHRIG